MGQWSREELEEAFARHQEVVVEIGKTWDWARYAELFTEDATYIEHLRQDGGPRADPRVDRLDDEHVPRQRDAASTR